MKALTALGLAVSIAFAVGCSSPAAEPEGHASSGTALADVLDMGDARRAMDALGAQLDAELGKVGPGLTPDQQKAYVAAFAADAQPAMKDAQAKYDAAADRVSAYLARRLPEVLSFARNQAPATSDGEELYSGYLVLSKTQHADEALAFFNSVANDPEFARLMALDDASFRDAPRPEDALADAAPYMVAAELAKHGDPVKALDAVTAKLERSLLGGAITVTSTSLKAIDVVRARETSGAESLDALVPRAEIAKLGSSAGAKLLGSVGTALALWTAKDKLTSGDFVGFLQAGAGATPGTLVLVGRLAQAVEAFRPFATTLIDVGTQVGPGIGLVLAALGTAQDVPAVLADADPAFKTKLFGDALATLGAIVVFANPEAGAIVIGVGSVIALVSSLVIDDHAKRAAEAAVLKRLGTIVPPDIAASFVASEDDKLWDLSEYPLGSWIGTGRLGLSGSQIQSLASRAPTFVRKGSHTDNGVTGLADLERACFGSSDPTFARDRLYGLLDAAVTAGGETGLVLLATSAAHAHVSGCDAFTAYLDGVAQGGADGLDDAARAAKRYLDDNAR